MNIIALSEVFKSTSVEEINAFLNDFHDLLLKHCPAPEGKLKSIPFAINAVNTIVQNLVDPSAQKDFLILFAKLCIINLDAIEREKLN